MSGIFYMLRHLRGMRRQTEFAAATLKWLMVSRGLILKMVNDDDMNDDEFSWYLLSLATPCTPPKVALG